MLVLACDTATPAVTVALYDGAVVVAGESVVDGRRHGELLAALIDKVLADAGASCSDLTAVGVGTGPGPYTGLRAGLMTARVLGSALGIPVHGVCTLDVLAAAAAGLAGRQEFIVATDARRQEVYWARYSAAGERLDGPRVSGPELLPAGLAVAGEGPLRYRELAGRSILPHYPAAGQLAQIVAERIAAGTPVAPAEPLYLRKPDAREPGRPKRVTP